MTSDNGLVVLNFNIAYCCPIKSMKHWCKKKFLKKISNTLNFIGLLMLLSFIKATEQVFS